MSDDYKVSLGMLTPIEWNPREITAEAMVALQTSISRGTANHLDWSLAMGYRLDTTITVNTNGNRIIGGHQRVKALQNLGQNWIHKDDITWITVEPDSPEEKERNISLNNEFNQGVFTKSTIDLLKGLQESIDEVDFSALALTTELGHLELKFDNPWSEGNLPDNLDNTGEGANGGEGAGSIQPNIVIYISCADDGVANQIREITGMAPNSLTIGGSDFLTAIMEWKEKQ